MIQQILNDPKRIFGLDIMRATAILMVLSSHSLWIYPESTSFLNQVLKLFGFLGVEIFFVLSGFLIGKILYEKFVTTDFTFKTIFLFLKRRWFRTLPNYYLILVINILIAFLIGYNIDGFWKYFFFLHNFSEPLPRFFNESWSLSVEEWTYLMLPILLFFVAKIKKVSKKYLFLILVLFLIFFFQMNKIGYNFKNENANITQWNYALKSVVIYRIDAIIYGVLARWIYINYLEGCKKNKFYLAFIGFLGLFVLFFGQSFFVHSDADHVAFYTLFLLPLNSMSVCCFFPFLYEFKLKNSIIKKTITYISVISYSVYLLHYGVVLQLMKFYFPTDKYGMNELHIYTIAFLLITFSSSSLLYFFYEKPITDLREKATQNR